VRVQVDMTFFWWPRLRGVVDELERHAVLLEEVLAFLHQGQVESVYMLTFGIVFLSAEIDEQLAVLTTQGRPQPHFGASKNSPSERRNASRARASDDPAASEPAKIGQPMCAQARERVGRSSTRAITTLSPGVRGLHAPSGSDASSMTEIQSSRHC